MKSAYELAMERLNKTAPMKQLSDDQKSKIAELNDLYRAKIAERELFIKERLAEAVGSGDYEAVEQIEKQLASERKTLEAELEEKKEAVRSGTA